MKLIAAAIVKLQSEIKPALKEAVNPAFKREGQPQGMRYADLTAVWEACRAPLKENGLCVVQTTDFDEHGAWLKTLLLHTSGESIEGRFPLRPTKPDMQGMGSALTYARRYGLSAMLGIVADVDDDGNAASAPHVNRDSLPPSGPIGSDVPDKKAQANQWGAVALKTIEMSKSYDDLGAWHRKYADTIASVRGHNEALHGRIVKALEKKQNELRGPMPVAAE